MSHVTYEWVMSHMNDSYHIWKSLDTYEWVMTHMNLSCHMWMGHVTCEWVMLHMNEPHYEVISHVNESWRRCESCHIWMSHVTYEWVMSDMNESCHKACHIRPRIRRARVTCHESCHTWPTYVWVVSHTWPTNASNLTRSGHVESRMNESWHTWLSHGTCHESCHMWPTNAWFLTRTFSHELSHTNFPTRTFLHELSHTNMWYRATHESYRTWMRYGADVCHITSPVTHGHAFVGHMWHDPHVSV